MRRGRRHHLPGVPPRRWMCRLIGKAHQQGLIDLAGPRPARLHHDRHRTVDDTPYGGRAGMVMRPELLGARPWTTSWPRGARRRPPSAGSLTWRCSFSQAMARELAARPWLAPACGRYEGIDERVPRRPGRSSPVTVVSLGDYVLGGGEVAVLAMVEAGHRAAGPGVIGNAESLVEESHEDGLLEYPVFTKPPLWRGRGIPEVPLSDTTDRSRGGGGTSGSGALPSADLDMIAGWTLPIRTPGTGGFRPTSGCPLPWQTDLPRPAPISCPCHRGEQRATARRSTPYELPARHGAGRAPEP